ncbi:MAG: gliding motility-associated C-terminal domain-containing protein, partial [Bacteroidales bacterium]|nr:gliding motility-associated C-terminal domain-containing protein [Bacteroidales bacterium]
CAPTREIVTKDFDLVAGGYISFDLRYGLQGANTPCDGPDAMREGVSLQYSTDYGDNWSDIAYFAPTGNILSTNPFTTLPTTFGPTNFTSWDTYTFQIPSAAKTTHTRIRWVQFYVNYYNGHFDDSWGIDNIKISRSIELDTRWHFGSDSVHPGYVQPVTDSLFIVYLLDYQNYNDTVLSDTLRVIVHQTPVFQFSLDTNRICLRDSLEIRLVGNYNYLWNFGDTSSIVSVSPPVETVYWVTSADDIGCSYTDSVIVFVEELPNINMVGDTVCAGDTATLSAHGGIAYEWREGETNPILNTVPYITTLYHVTVTGDNNCKDTASVLAYVYQLPAGEAHGDTVICFGDQVELWASGGKSYEWSNGTTLSTNNVMPNNDLWYSVTITDNHNCSVVDSARVMVNPLNEILITALPDTVCRGTSSLITATGAEVYTWSNGMVGDGIEVFPGTPTAYTVTASLSYVGLSCSKTASIYLHVEECNTLHVANAFNPEGFSQVFKPIGNFFSISNYCFAIYDRWGKLIFETTDWDSGWDGKIRGNYAPNGAYVFVVRFRKEYLDQSYERVGTVTVIR